MERMETREKKANLYLMVKNNMAELVFFFADLKTYCKVKKHWIQVCSFVFIY